VKDRRTIEDAAAVSPKSEDRMHDQSDESGRKARFARALTQSVFGRHYWDDRLEAELRRQLTISKQRHQK